MFSFLSPYKLLIDLAVFGALFAGATYEVHSFLMYERELGAKAEREIWQAKEAKAEQEHTALVARLQKEKDDADVNAAAREKSLAAALTVVSGSSAGLRSAIAAVDAKVASVSIDAARQYATTAGSLLGECQQRYIEMGKAAAGHASDSLKLQQAWPN